MSILPRTNNTYKRLDTDGTGPRRGRWFGWKKFAVVAGLIIGLVWVFGPRERREQVLDTIKQKTPTWGRPTHPPTTKAHPGINDDPSKGSGTSKKPVKTPHSPADDPDPLKTVHCLEPHNPDARLVQYALMIDAGSTGSRIHIYKFNNCGASAEYEYEVFKQTHPGLSAYAGHPEQGAESLDVLLDEAVSVVPKSLHACTPVAVKATAGLRLLGPTTSAAILAAVRHRLETHYPFSVVEKNGVEIMDGKDEGVYAWITANYLLDTLRADSPATALPYAVLDLGGASTQIVFEPSLGVPGAHLEEGDHKYELRFGGKTHTLYQHSYLGYGLMRARKNVHRLVEFMWNFHHKPEQSDTNHKEAGEIANPCLARGTKRVVEVEGAVGAEGVTKNVTMSGKDVGGYEACNRIVELVLAKDAVCHVKPCSFDGVYQPSILDTFPKGKILLLSYFYDRIAPFYPSGSLPSLTVSSLTTLAKLVCEGETSWKSQWRGDDSLLHELAVRPEWCLDLTFMHALLRLGYEFADDREVRIEKQVDGTELGWCLGATIAIVGGQLTCKV
ncbi:hypothetical protein BD410DRAFT_788834 [Rickenella mellea]|uniref:guanosine-diphosphatase n=1 Tax=Rickenella mellea TaxID=50990 RepID=A0A4Y7Q4K0_9AGAM|nr:hypothetical protein BD410DRAFT_788834 [Rickenella mellea]